MNLLKRTEIIIAIIILVIIIIIEVGKSVRINQLKEIETSKIESMGKYEKKAKNDYLKPFNEKSKKLNKE